MKQQKYIIYQLEKKIWSQIYFLPFIWNTINIISCNYINAYKIYKYTKIMIWSKIENISSRLQFFSVCQLSLSLFILI